MENKKLLDSFCNYLDFLINRQHQVMEQTDNNIMLHRSQGAVATLRRLKYIRQEVLGESK